MKLHTVFITYNRLELTKRAIESYFQTVTVPFTLMVVDNRSTDGTIQYLNEALEHHLWVVLDRNYYPGTACNLGWSHAPQDADFLHRADNDFIFLPGWCEEVESAFRSNKIGQVGLRTSEQECLPGRIAPQNVGGNCVIRRELWDAGLRYDERPWPELAEAYGRGYTEDSLLSPAVRRMGYTWTRVKNPCIQPIAVENPDDEYYVQSWADRGMRK